MTTGIKPGCGLTVWSPIGRVVRSLNPNLDNFGPFVNWPGEFCRGKRGPRLSLLLTLSGAVILAVMCEVTRILSAIEQGDPHAAAQLLPLVYDELRKLAAQKLAHEAPGQTLQATALVHEAYLRLVTPPHSPPSPGEEGKVSPPCEGGDQGGVRWNSRGHF